MIRRLLAIVAIFAFAAPALADGKVDFKKIKGSWEREANDFKIVFEFKDEKKMVCHMTPPNAGKSIDFDCEIKIDDKGNVTGTIKSVEKNGLDADGAPAAGTKFSFKAEPGEKKLILSDGKVDDAANEVINGEYTKK